MDKKLLIFKRKKAKELHEEGRSNREIARHLLASKNSVGKWVQIKKNYEKQTGEKVSKSYVDGVLKEAGMVKSPEKRG